jgi:hypothetical protein
VVPGAEAVVGATQTEAEAVRRTSPEAVAVSVESGPVIAYVNGAIGRARVGLVVRRNARKMRLIRSPVD